jgi:hypothetical protein
MLIIWTAIGFSRILLHEMSCLDGALVNNCMKRLFLTIIQELKPTISRFCTVGMCIFLFLISIVGFGVQTGSTWHVGHFWPIIPAPVDCEDGEFGGMKIGKGHRSTRRKPAPAPLCPPQIPLDKTRAAAVGSQRITAWAMARPYLPQVR